MKKRILIYCTQLMPSGGIENHIIEFCKNMLPHFEIDLLVANFKMELHEETLKKNCSRVFFIKPVNPLKRRIILMKTLLNLSVKRYDVLYTNGNGASVFLAAKMLRYKKWVLHHHMEADQDFFQALNPKYKKSMLLADRVIACSNINAANLNRELKRPVDAVYCFSRDLSNSKKMRRNINSSNNLHFGYYGRLIPAKGIDLICRLSEDPDCRNISFHLWGTGNEYSTSFFNKYPNLYFHGAFSKGEELNRIVSLLDAFLLFTTHAEGLPISLLEIMSAGIPWISANKGGIADIACDPVSTKIIDIKDYAVIKQTVLQLACDIKNGHISGDKQQAFYKQHFSREVLIDKWESVFTS